MPNNSDREQHKYMSKILMQTLSALKSKKTKISVIWDYLGMLNEEGSLTISLKDDLRLEGLEKNIPDGNNTSIIHRYFLLMEQ